MAPAARLVPAATAQALVCTSGLAGFDPVTLSRLLTGKVVSLGCSVTRYGEGLSGSSAPADLETLLQLIYLQFTAPRLDSQVVARYRASLDDALLHRDADPHQAMADTLRLLLADHSPEVRLLDSSYVEALDPAASLAFFRERFSDPTGFTFLLVGSFDPDTITPLLERYLGGLPVVPPADRQPPRGLAPPAGEYERVLHGGAEPRATTALVYHTEGPISRQETLAATAMVHALRIRLQDRLRQQLGGVYGVEVGASLTPVPGPSYRVSIGFDADPARQPELLAAVRGEVARLVRGGLTRDEMQAFREERRRSLETARLTNGYWLSAIATADQRGWPLEEIPLDRDADALDRAEVQRAAGEIPGDRRQDPGNPTAGVGIPFAAGHGVEYIAFPRSPSGSAVRVGARSGVLVDPGGTDPISPQTRIIA